MKRSLLLLSILSIWCSCGKLQQPKLEDNAIAQMKTSIISWDNQSADPVFSNLNIVFQNDSLCVIHYDVMITNNRGQQRTYQQEYIYLESGGYDYECIIGSNFVFMGESEYDRVKKGKIYEKLPYKEGLVYRLIKNIRYSGRNLTDPEAGILVKNPMGIGDWDVKDVVDKFGNPTGEKYLSLRSMGHYDMPSVKNNDLEVFLSIRKDGGKYLSFKKSRYTEIYVTEPDIYITINAPEGEFHSFAESGFYEENKVYREGFSNIYHLIYEKPIPVLQDCLSKEQSLQFFAKEEEYNYTFRWKFNFEGYNEALKYIE